MPPLIKEQANLVGGAFVCQSEFFCPGQGPPAGTIFGSPTWTVVTELKPGKTKEGMIIDQRIDSSGFVNTNSIHPAVGAVTVSEDNHSTTMYGSWDETPGIHTVTCKYTGIDCEGDFFPVELEKRYLVKAPKIKDYGPTNFSIGYGNPTVSIGNNTFVGLIGDPGSATIDSHGYPPHRSDPGITFKFGVDISELKRGPLFEGNFGIIQVRVSSTDSGPPLSRQSSCYRTGPNGNSYAYCTTYPNPLPIPEVSAPDIVHWKSGFESFPFFGPPPNYNYFSNLPTVPPSDLVTLRCSPYYEFKTSMTDFSVHDIFHVFVVIKQAGGRYVSLYRLTWHWGGSAFWQGPGSTNPAGSFFDASTFLMVSHPSTQQPDWYYSSDQFIDSTTHKMYFVNFAQGNSLSTSIGWLGNPYP